MRVAAIDCGTNSIRLLVWQTEADGSRSELARRTEMVRLGQGVDSSGEFHADALGRTFAACTEFADELAALGGVDRLRFAATSAARDARNRDEFFAGVQQRLGVVPEVLTGEDEARLSFAGALTGVVRGHLAGPALVSEPNEVVDPVLVVDIGGGSTELIRGRRAVIEQAQSLDIGAVRLRERFLTSDPPKPEQIEAARAFVRGLLDSCEVSLTGVGTWIGVAGTATTMAAVSLGLPAYDRALVHRSRLSRATIAKISQRWLGSSVDQVRAEPSMHPKRAEVICAGGLILDEIAARVECELVVSECDILDGLAASLLD